MFCRHSYDVVYQDETKSEAEQLASLGLRPNTHSSFVKKYIVILRCSKCGKIKQFVVRA